MSKYIIKHIKPARFKGLPESMRQALREARLNRGLSQLELGARIGLPQMHISGIETGKIVPRFNTLIDLVRTLDFDLVLVPRSLVPMTQTLIHNQSNHERSLYADDSENDAEESPHDEV